MLGDSFFYFPSRRQRMSHLLNTNVNESDMPLRQIRRIQFGILSPDEIRRMSVTKESIIHADTLEGGKPKSQGLLDPRQGPADRHSKCLTCSGSYDKCPGHFGHIERQYIYIPF